MKTVNIIDKLDLDRLEAIIKDIPKSLPDRAVVINVIIANNQMLTDSNHNIFNAIINDNKGTINGENENGN